MLSIFLESGRKYTAHRACILSLTLVDKATYRAQIVFGVIQIVDVVVHIHVQLSVVTLSQLSAGKYANSLGLAFFLCLLDESGVHIRGLVDLTLGTGDQISVGALADTVKVPLASL